MKNVDFKKSIVYTNEVARKESQDLPKRLVHSKLNINCKVSIN